jgi:NTP pyrophosphatase (non-canonical NTP hydrolase)
MKIDDEVFDKAKRALEKWGEKAQTHMAVGEMGELLELFGKEAQGRADSEDWTDEIADVYVILPALVMTYSSKEKVENRVSEKLEKLEQILKEKLDHPHNEQNK